MNDQRYQNIDTALLVTWPVLSAMAHRCTLRWPARSGPHNVQAHTVPSRLSRLMIGTIIWLFSSADSFPTGQLRGLLIQAKHPHGIAVAAPPPIVMLRIGVTVNGGRPSIGGRSGAASSTVLIRRDRVPEVSSRRAAAHCRDGPHEFDNRFEEDRSLINRRVSHCLYISQS